LTHPVEITYCDLPAMNPRLPKFVAALCLTMATSGLGVPATRAQAAAEYREQTEPAKAWPQKAVRSAHGMVATDVALGSQAGVEILQRGGNAIDAAVAVGFRRWFWTVLFGSDDLGSDLVRYVSSTCTDSHILYCPNGSKVLSRP
jgi:hypothetical protein